jgi:hypothetical protein
MRGDPKIPGNVEKKIFKIFSQISKFIPLQNSLHVTGCSDLSAAPTAGNNVYNL